MVQLATGNWCDRPAASADKLPQDRVDERAVRDAAAPRLRDAGLAEAGPRDLAADGAGGVGVVAEVDRPQHRVAEVVRAVAGPKGGLEAPHHVTGADDLRRLLPTIAALGDLEHLGVEREQVACAGQDGP